MVLRSLLNDRKGICVIAAIVASGTMIGNYPSLRLSCTLAIRAAIGKGNTNRYSNASDATLTVQGVKSLKMTDIPERNNCLSCSCRNVSRE